MQRKVGSRPCPDESSAGDAGVWHSVRRLNEQEQTTLRLACVDRLRCAEIAERTGTTKDEVVRMIAEAMGALRRAVAALPDPAGS